MHAYQDDPSVPGSFAEMMQRIAQGKNVQVGPLAEAIGITKGGLYVAIRRGEVIAVRIGAAVFVPAQEAKRLLGMKPETPAAIAA